MKNQPAATLGTANGNGHNGNGNGHGQPKLVPIIAPPPALDEDDFELGHLLGVLKRRALTFVGVATLTAGGLMLWHLSRPSVYRGSADLLVEPVTVVNELEIGESPLPQGVGNAGLDYTSQIRVLRSPTVLEPIVDQIQQRYPQITYSNLLNRLTISREGDSKILRVAYSDADPEVVEFVTAQLAEGFIDYSVQNRQGDLRRGLTFLEEQLAQKWDEVDDIEARLSAFQKRYDLVNVDAVSESVTQRLNEMASEWEALLVEQASLQTLSRNLQDQVGYSPDLAVRVANLNESPTYQSLLGELRQIEQEIALQSARFRPDTPMIEVLEDKRQQLLPLLEDEAQRVLGTSAANPQDLGFQGAVSQDLTQQLVNTTNQIQVLQSRSDAIDIVTADLQAKIQRIADLSRSYQQIQRELDVAESSLNQILASRQELRFQMARQVSPWELMSPLDQSSVMPVTNLPRKLILSAVVGLIAGAAAALLRDKADQVFHSVDDLVEAAKLPSLAAVPHSPALQSQPLLMDSRLTTTVEEILHPESNQKRSYASFSFGEAFYSLDANLRLLSSDTPVQVVAITSSLPGEGKSTTCAHLAIAAANMGRRVLLVDGDFRHPSVHGFFNLPNRFGLSDLITQSTRTEGIESEAVQTIAENPNLHVLTAGTQPPAPGRLLSSKKMQHIIAAYRQNYDLVIFDTPPLMGIIDAKLIAAQSDGMLLVTRLRKTPRHEVQRVLSDLSNTVQAPLLGLVVNGIVNSRRRGYYADYYGYYGSSAGRSVPSPAGRG